MPLDIHPRENPIRSFRDFLVQIFTVTCGILIALWLEGRVEHRRNAELLEQARWEFKDELTKSLERMQAERASEARTLTWLTTTVAFLDATLKHQPAKDPGDYKGFDFLYLRSAAWDSALATQAIKLLTPRETDTISRVYNAQEVHNSLTTRAQEQLFGLSGYEDAKDLPPEELRVLDRGIRISVNYAHLMEELEDNMISQYQDALKAIRAAETG